jgi:acyl-coenzyme A synthetase/AMP-(fatty) acid ligase
MSSTSHSAAAFDYDSTWKSWDPWQPVPERYNLGHALTAGIVADGKGQHPALLWENSAGDQQAFTYAQLDTLTNRLASSLANLGIKRGDRVFLRLPNLPEFYIAALAVAKLGAVFIPSSTLFREEEIEYRLNDSGAVAAVTIPQLVEPLLRVQPNCPALEHLIVAPYCNQQAGPHTLDFRKLIADGADPFPAADTANDDVAFLAYTSGTTGDPKGVVHYQRYPVAYDSLIRWWHDYRDDDVVACPAEVGWLLPVASTFLYAMRRGLTIVLYHPVDGRFDARQWFRLIEKYRITNFTGTPTIYRMMLAAEEHGRQHDLSSLRHGVSAGEPLPPDTFEGIRNRLGIRVLDGIGMSECMVYCFNMIGMPLREGSCGRPGPGTGIKLMDDDLNEVPRGTPGVLCVKTATHPGMMREYWNKPEQTAEVFRGAWYWSGDVLTQDGDGYFWFQGRADDVIKASGYRISPFEVESCLVSHPAVLEAAAVESPDAVRGNVVKAFVVLRKGHPSSPQLADQIQQWVKQRIAPYKYPRKIEFVPSLPKTQSGKVKRRLLRAAEFGGAAS